MYIIVAGSLAARLPRDSLVDEKFHGAHTVMDSGGACRAWVAGAAQWARASNVAVLRSEYMGVDP